VEIPPWGGIPPRLGTTGTEHTESKARNTDALPSHFMIYSSRCWDVFLLTWCPAFLKCYGPRATLIRHWVRCIRYVRVLVRFPY